MSPVNFKILINAAQCANCKDFLISFHRHDYKTCSCGSISIDGGRDYFKRCAMPGGDLVDYSFWIEDGVYHTSFIPVPEPI